MNRGIQKVVDTIQQYMAEDGQLVWHKAYFSAPQSNGISKHAYRGVNHFVTSIVSVKAGYSSPYWATFKQIRDAGGTLKDAKGKGVPIIFYKEHSSASDESRSDTKKRFTIRHSFVFNFDLVEGIELTVDQHSDNGIKTDANAESVMAAYFEREKIRLVNGMSPAYIPATDAIRMPLLSHYASQAEYYCDYFHETVHSTGHSKRLHRFEVGQVLFESKEEHSKEELAEVTAALMCNHCGVDSQASIKNSAAYLQGRSKFISDNAQAFVSAVNQAYKARDFILNDVEKEHLV